MEKKTYRAALFGDLNGKPIIAQLSEFDTFDEARRQSEFALLKFKLDKARISYNNKVIIEIVDATDNYDPEFIYYYIGDSNDNN